MDIASALSIAPALLASFFLGAVIGVERQWRQRTGLTTHAIVALGAAAFTSLTGLSEVAADPVRMGGQVVTGIGFLGAGLIIRDGLSVRGLSAAATVWATGAVGTLAGSGHVLESAEVTAIIVLGNIGLPRLTGLVDRLSPQAQTHERYYRIGLQSTAEDEASVRTELLQALSVKKLKLSSLESRALEAAGRIGVEAVVYSSQARDDTVEAIVGELALSKHIFAARWSTEDSPN